jgi:hypothetical protein
MTCKFAALTILAVAGLAAQTNSPRTPTWNGLAFGMTKDEVKAVLKDRHIHISDDGDFLNLSGDMVVGEGKATLHFSPAHRLEKIALWFQFGDYADDDSTVSNEEALRRIVQAKSITEKYLRRYGRAVSDIGNGFPGDGTEDHWKDQWTYDLVSHRPWLIKHSWRWREDGQSIEFRGDLLGRAAVISVDYLLEERNY